jgi:hypothetical protein
MYLKIRDVVEIREALEVLSNEELKLSKEGGEAYNLLMMKFHLFVV